MVCSQLRLVPLSERRFFARRMQGDSHGPKRALPSGAISESGKPTGAASRGKAGEKCVAVCVCAKKMCRPLPAAPRHKRRPAVYVPQPADMQWFFGAALHHLRFFAHLFFFCAVVFVPLALPADDSPSGVSTRNSATPAANLRKRGRSPGKGGSAAAGNGKRDLSHVKQLVKSHNLTPVGLTRKWARCPPAERARQARNNGSRKSWPICSRPRARSSSVSITNTRRAITRAYQQRQPPLPCRP